MFTSIRRQFLGVLGRNGSVPAHVAFILDGNRRWARKRGLKTINGHIAGYQRLFQILEWCYEFGISTVSIYVFSEDNLQRKKSEVKNLIRLVTEKANELIADPNSMLMARGVKINLMGDLDLLPNRSLQQKLARLLHKARENHKKYIESTPNPTRNVLNLGFLYSGTREIADATNAALSSRLAPELLTRDLVSACMYGGASQHPNPDVLIRTSGETRLSDFMMWQLTEGNAMMQFVKVLWPDFSFRHFVRAMQRWQNFAYFERLDARRKQKQKRRIQREDARREQREQLHLAMYQPKRRRERGQRVRHRRGASRRYARRPGRGVRDSAASLNDLDYVADAAASSRGAAPFHSPEELLNQFRKVRSALRDGAPAAGADAPAFDGGSTADSVRHPMSEPSGGADSVEAPNSCAISSELLAFREGAIAVAAPGQLRRALEVLLARAERSLEVLNDEAEIDLKDSVSVRAENSAILCAIAREARRMIAALEPRREGAGADSSRDDGVPSSDGCGASGAEPPDAPFEFSEFLKTLPSVPDAEALFADSECESRAAFFFGEEPSTEIPDQTTHLETDSYITETYSAERGSYSSSSSFGDDLSMSLSSCLVEISSDFISDRSSDLRSLATEKREFIASLLEERAKKIIKAARNQHE